MQLIAKLETLASGYAAGSLRRQVTVAGRVKTCLLYTSRLRDHDRHSRAGADGIKAASARGRGAHDEAGENDNARDHQNRHDEAPFLRDEGEDQIGV